VAQLLDGNSNILKPELHVIVCFLIEKRHHQHHGVNEKRVRKD